MRKKIYDKKFNFVFTNSHKNSPWSLYVLQQFLEFVIEFKETKISCVIVLFEKLELN